MFPFTYMLIYLESFLNRQYLLPITSLFFILYQIPGPGALCTLHCSAPHAGILYFIISREHIMKNQGISRREFVGTLASSMAGVMIVPRHVLGGPGFRAPSDTLNIAMIGAGGMGSSNAEQLTSQNIVALADVDFSRVEASINSRLQTRSGEARPEAAKLGDAYANAARYSDFRKMLDEQQDIDAVVVATPDHFHAIAANHAMKMGKHVYVQKPLTWSVREARVLQQTAEETGVVTQMGNQGHSSDGGRRAVEWIRSGVLGPVHEVHIWTNRPVWPQGIPRPRPGEPASQIPWNQAGVQERVASALGGSYQKPADLDWDVFLGPAPFVEYHPIYHPFNWRGWVDWGVGALGDMGAHLIDHAYWGLELEYPTRIWATSSPFGGDRRDPASWPYTTMVQYEFERPDGNVRMMWYDGGLVAPRPEVLPMDVELSREGGAIVIGEKGILIYETYGHNPRIFPAALAEEAEGVPESLPRIDTSHEMNWANAAMGLNEPSSPFSYAAPLTETMLLGMVALRAGQPIEYDGANMKITNVPEANQYLEREYREGWEL